MSKKKKEELKKEVPDEELESNAEEQTEGIWGNKTFQIIAILLTITVLGFVSYGRFQKIKDSISNIDFKEIELPSNFLDINTEIEQTEEIVKKEFVSSDGRFKLEYLSDWKSLGEESFAINKSETSTDPSITFSASKFLLESPIPPTIVVYEVLLEEGDTLSTLLTKTKNLFEGEGIKIEIVSSNLFGNENVFEMNYIKNESTKLKIKGKIVMSGEKAYVTSIFTQESIVNKVISDINYIINSISLII